MFDTTYETTSFLFPISDLLSDAVSYVQSYVGSYVLFEVKDDVRLVKRDGSPISKELLPFLRNRTKDIYIHSVYVTGKVYNSSIYIYSP